MPDFDVRLDDHGTTVFIQGLADRSRDLRPAHMMVGEIMYASTMENFEEEHDPWGNPWMPSSPFTLREKRRLGRIMKVLQSTGIMKSRTNYKVARDSVTIGNYDNKARKHHEGIDTPQRVFLGVSDEDLAEISAAYADYVSEGAT